MVIWSIIEIYTAMICACIIAVRPLLVHFLPSIFPGTRNPTATYPSQKSGSFRPKMDSKISGKIWSTNHNGIELLSREELSGDAGSPRDLGIKKTTNFELREEFESGGSGSGSRTVKDEARGELGGLSLVHLAT